MSSLLNLLNKLNSYLLIYVLNFVFSCLSIEPYEKQHTLLLSFISIQSLFKEKKNIKNQFFRFIASNLFKFILK